MESLVVGFVISFVANWMFFWTIRAQQKILDTLTNKLMAKDYREYVQMGKPPVPVRDDDKPLSWYDH